GLCSLDHRRRCPTPSPQDVKRAEPLPLGYQITSKATSARQMTFWRRTAGTNGGTRPTSSSEPASAPKTARIASGPSTVTINRKRPAQRGQASTANLHRGHDTRGSARPSLEREHVDLALQLARIARPGVLGPDLGKGVHLLRVGHASRRELIHVARDARAHERSRFD